MAIQYPVKDIHTLEAAAVLRAFETDSNAGISGAEAAVRSAQFGVNKYAAQKQQPVWLLFLRQFTSPIVYLLVFGAAVSLFYKDYIDAIAIAAVIVINALIGFLMELQARISMNALKEMDTMHATVIRDEKTQQVPAEALTPGDIILFEAGDVIPGDGRLLEVNQLQCDESSLTGESLPTVKNTAALPKETATGDMLNMVFKGSAVMNGKGKAVVTGIAGNTELGTITSLVATAATTKTPLDKKIDALSKRLILITLIMTGIFVLTGYLQGKKWVLIIETAIALAVAAIPEGLPIVCTVALAHGMLLMAKRNAIVKKLSSVETLGSTTVILTDKTGTLTENKIYIETICFPEEDLPVTTKDNQLQFDKNKMTKSTVNFEKLRLTGALCNNAVAKTGSDGDTLLGDPIEIALIALAGTDGFSEAQFKKQYERVAEIPFNSEIKMMGTLHKTEAGYLVAAKGSAEQLLEQCVQWQKGDSVHPMSGEDKKATLAAADKMSANGLRVLAFAYKEGATVSHDDFLKELVYIGMIGFLDPPRLDIKPAVLSCREAGIKIVMITGDHPMTALNIARQTGVTDEGDAAVITGKDLPAPDAMTTEWRNKILATAVFARATPKQKLEIAGVYQAAGNIVAMTGDGVNDAPALKKADVGIAMGLRGTPVAKETASIILKDDSFISIAEAVAYGRTIFRNIQKFVIYLVSCNLSEILIVTVFAFIAPALSLLPLQILFLNMVTDIFPALALGVGKKDVAVMLKPPRDTAKDIISRKNWGAVVIYATVITLSVIAAVYYCQLVLGTDSKQANNVAFITLAFAQLFHVFNMASLQSGMVNNEITRNKFVWMAIVLCAGCMVLVYALPATRLALNLTVLPLQLWMVSIVAALLPLLLLQLYKGLYKMRRQ